MRIGDATIGDYFDLSNLHAAALEETPHRALQDPQPMRDLQMRGNLRQRHVGRLIDQGQDLIGVRLNALRAFVTALRSGLDRARPAPLLYPFDRRRSRNPEPLRRDMPASTAQTNRCRKSVERDLVMQAGLLHQPALRIGLRPIRESPMILTDRKML